MTTADAGDSVVLSAMAKRAKSYWNYPSEWIELWKEDLTLTEEYINSNMVYKAMEPDSNQIIGTCAVEQLSEKEVEIAHFWIEPEFMGKGVGRQLITKALEYAEQQEATRVEVLSDPNAREFYQRFGFRFIGEREGVPKGRFLPVLEKVLFTES